MLHAGLDLSRKRLDYCLLDERGERLEVGAAPPDADGLTGLARHVEQRHGPVAVRGAIESMNGARFVHDALERSGWEVEVADAPKVRGLAPLACKTDRIDAWCWPSSRAAIWCRRSGCPASSSAQSASGLASGCIWSATAPRSSIVSTPSCWPSGTRARSATFGRQGRELLARLCFPEPWRSGVLAAVAMIDDLDAQIASIDSELRQLGADHRYVPLLMTVPGIAWVLGYTIAAEIGDIDRFGSPTKLCGYTGLCPRVYQSGSKDRRGQLTHAGPKYLRWALIEAAQHACRHPLYRDRYKRTKSRLGKQRGPKVAQVDIARRLAEAIWHMLTRNQPFAPAGATRALAA